LHRLDAPAATAERAEHPERLDRTLDERSRVPLPLLLGVLAVIPPASLVLTRVMGRAAGWPIGAAFLAIAAAMVPSAVRVTHGEVLTWSAAWVPGLGLDLSLRLDGLGVIFIGLALVIGALVFFYSTTYFTKGDQRGFYLIMTAFTFAMVGLVLSDNLILMFLTWELTSLASFLLIARSGHAGEAASMRTMLLTFIGGLALLVAVALIVVRTGTSSFVDAVGSPIWAQDPAFTSLVAVLVAMAGFSKAAQFPFHLWLPDAMAAATPVSAYLHAAAVVKAGIYLLFRFTIIFGDVLIWNVLLIGLGLFTAVLSGYFALQQTDLKKLMAYSTVSQLGLITATIGVGTDIAIAAALLHTIAHACFKSGLFMIVGIIDHQTGTRAIDRLPALRRSMPWTFAVAVVGAASMAGVPPLFGFISKENIFAALIDARGGPVVGPVLLAVAAIASVLTFLYCGKIIAGAFIDGPEPTKPIHEVRWITLLPAALPILVGVPLAFTINRFAPIVEQAVVASHAVSEHDASFELWHGPNLELGVTLLVFVIGLALLARRAVLRPRVERPVFAFDGASVLTAVAKQTERVGDFLADLVRADNPARHVAAIVGALTTVLAAGSGLVWLGGQVPPVTAGVNSLVDVGVLIIVTLAVIALVQARSRIGATVLLGGIGVAMTVQIFLLGAADVGLTQLLVEILTVLVIMLVLRKLPVEFSRKKTPQRLRNGIIAVSAGLASALAAWTVIGRRERSEVGEWYLANAPEVTGGDNIVNVILVELRALDTFGELAVLGMAGVAIIAVLCTIPRALLDPEPDPDPDSLPTYVPAPQIAIGEDGSRSYRALEDVEANTEPLRLLQRVLVPILVVISVVLFWRGHNEPGGGFIAALVGACAVAFVYMAKVRDEPVSRPWVPIALIVGGLLVALATGLLGYLGGGFLQPLYVEIVGTKFASSMLFDVGVYTAVLGLVMVAFNVLGSEGATRQEAMGEPDESPATAEVSS
jgi:multicomponent Na+:H+ antiporter subunit A